MSLELTIITILGALTVVHVWFNSVYSNRIRQLEGDMSELVDADIVEDDYLGNAILDNARMSAQAKVDRVNNHYHILVQCVCLAGLAAMFALNQAGFVTAMEWMSIIVLPLPAYLTIYNFRNAFTLYVRRNGRSLKNVT